MFFLIFFLSPAVSAGFSPPSDSSEVALPAKRDGKRVLTCLVNELIIAYTHGTSLNLAHSLYKKLCGPDRRWAGLAETRLPPSLPLDRLDHWEPMQLAPTQR